MNNKRITGITKNESHPKLVTNQRFSPVTVNPPEISVKMIIEPVEPNLLGKTGVSDAVCVNLCAKMRMDAPTIPPWTQEPVSVSISVPSGI